MRLKKNLGPGMVVHRFNPRTQQGVAGKSLSLRSTWSTDQVSGHSSLGSEGDHQNQEASKDVIE